MPVQNTTHSTSPAQHHPTIQAFPARPFRTMGGVTMPLLSCPSTPHQTTTVHATPHLPLRTTTGQTIPHMTCQTKADMSHLGHTIPALLDSNFSHITTPFLPVQITPNPDAPLITIPALRLRTQPTTHHQSCHVRPNAAELTHTIPAILDPTIYTRPLLLGLTELCPTVFTTLCHNLNLIVRLLPC